MSYFIQIVELDAHPALIVKGLVNPTEISAFLGQAFGECMTVAKPQGAEMNYPPFSRWFSGSAPPFDMAGGIGLTKAVYGEGRVEATELPGGRALQLDHYGEYRGLTAAYEALRKYMTEQELAPRAGPWEAYITDPAAEPDSAKWLTKVYWPID